MNSIITIKEIEFIIENLPQKTLGPNNFTGEFYQMFKAELTSVVHNLFQN